MSGLLFNARDFSQIDPANPVQLGFEVLAWVGQLRSGFELGQMLLDTTITFLDFGLAKAEGFQRGFQSKEQCLVSTTMQTLSHRFP